MERKHEKYERLIARCKAMAPIPTAVAHPCDESSLRGAVEAAEMGILQADSGRPAGQDRSRGGTVSSRHIKVRNS
jgi:hypothetical protein